MRSSKRERIVAGALEIIEREGIEALTFDSLAEHVGLTRGGIVYHFRTREALFEGIAQDLLTRWQSEALQALGQPWEQATRNQRISALAISVLDGSLLRGEFAFLISGRPEADALRRAWTDFQREWIGDAETLTLEQKVGLLAINGWWIELASGTDYIEAMDTPTRAFIISLISGEFSPVAG
ncbi:TetR/AcrR family transcriptional regulator [Actinomyces sp. MRS3W]|uniref:TetR/AcrR family transcriptional regulator n=1 Tax=Actinomyces sp. MRS3W TaxID=2800796 RepID=UPI0028FDBFB8|nr:TetR family transcriptional regulator [Actinomyces sp. MRS3W]MDU0349794.1 TetR family transcriptional regulator [Actinomyces sp. MRS3W]